MLDWGLCNFILQTARTYQNRTDVILKTDKAWLPMQGWNDYV